MGEYQDVLTKLKSAPKPAGTIRPTRPTGGDSVKNRAGQDGEDTTPSSKTPVTTGTKRPAMTARPTTAKPRSDSKESTKSKEKTAEEKRKEAE